MYQARLGCKFAVRNKAAITPHRFSRKSSAICCHERLVKISVCAWCAWLTIYKGGVFSGHGLARTGWATLNGASLLVTIESIYKNKRFWHVSHKLYLKT